MRSHPSHRRRNSLTALNASFKDKLAQNIIQLRRKVVETWKSATLTQRIIFVVGFTTFQILGLLFLIYSHKIFDALGPIAHKWRALPGGWLILFFATFFTAFPPIIGYSTCLTIAGFVFGMKGWFICAGATVAGSLASFIASRTVLSRYVHNLVGQDKRFTAFALTLKHDGVKILVMIRLCPLPYSLSNAALSTFPTVHPLSFALATAAATPKLLIHVFVGSRLAVIAEEGGKMDLTTKIVNYASIIGFGILGVAIGYLIYQKTVDRARQIEEEENQALHASPGRERGSYFEDLEQGAEETDTLVDDEFGDDDISLWENDDSGAVPYRDHSSDEERRTSRNCESADPTLLDEEPVVGGHGRST